MAQPYFFVLRIIIIYYLTTQTNGQLPNGKQFSLMTCGKYPQYQQWNVYNNGTTYKLSFVNYSKSCLDCAGCSKGAFPHVWNCDPNLSNQWFNVVDLGSSKVGIQSQTELTCLTATENTEYAGISMNLCNPSDPKQQWTLNNPNKYYISNGVNASFCLTANYYPTNNCSVSPFNQYPYCDSSLPVNQRVNDLMSRMTISEKITNLQNNNNGVARLGIPPNVFHEALHGVVSSCGQVYNNNTGCPTSFPHATLMSASFNRSLWKHVAIAISDEARALRNQGIVGLFFWAPDINLFRDPRWGRGQEVPGEDPFLTGEYVAQYAYHMQHGEDKRYLKVVSTAKHYADYDQEGNYGTNRGDFDANVTSQDQVEYYWPAWRSAVEVGHIQSIMCSYNAVNNMPSCGNNYFMNEIARDEWGFDGFFVSDCGALSDPAFNRYAAQMNYSLEQQAAAGLNGGCDVECGSFYQSTLPTAYQQGFVTYDDITQAASRLFTKSFELGMMDNPGPYYNTYGPDIVDSPKHRDLALDAAKQSIVLLKNDMNILPLKKTMKIACIGPHANATQSMLSIYRGTNILVNSHSPYQAMKSNGISVTYTQACDIDCNNTNGFVNAVNAAKAADVAIVFLGLHPGQGDTPAREDEGWDRENITFVGEQLTLLQQVYAANAKAILVLIHGGAIDLTWPKTNVAGIVDAFYPGELGGDALYSILFGDVSPAGKLPVTIYDIQLTINRASIMDMSLRNNGGITYRYYQGTPVYKFGYGLSYTTFSYKYYNNSNIQCVDAKNIGDMRYNKNNDKIIKDTSFIVQVTNTGNMASDCVVLGFVTSDNGNSIKLFDFQRTYVDVGNSVNVTLSISPYSISLTNKLGHERIVPGKYKLLLGDYQNNNFVNVDFCINGDEYSLFNLPKIMQQKKKKK